MLSLQFASRSHLTPLTSHSSRLTLFVIFLKSLDEPARKLGAAKGYIHYDAGQWCNKY